MNEPASDLAVLVLAFVKREVPPPVRNNITLETDFPNASHMAVAIRDFSLR